MKKQRLFLILVTICILALFSSCETSQLKYEFTGDDGLSVEGIDYQASAMKVDCCDNNGNNYTVSQPDAYRIYQALETETFKGIRIEYNSTWQDEYISLWFHNDTTDMGELSGSCIIYKNEIVEWSAAPYTDLSTSYKAPDGTFESIVQLLSSITAEQ